jgi:hypothetical protein
MNEIPSKQTLEESLEKGRQAANKLAVAVDALGAHLYQVERALCEMGWDVTESVAMAEGRGPLEDETLRIPARLKFGKVGKEWRLTVEVSSGTLPIASAPRGLKLRAAASLAALVQSLSYAAENQHRQAVEADEAVQKVLATLRP